LSGFVQMTHAVSGIEPLLAELGRSCYAHPPDWTGGSLSPEQFVRVDANGTVSAWDQVNHPLKHT
jgi:hypothetical protein